MDKKKVLAKLNEAIEDLIGKIEQINEGDIDFSEAGDWLHNWGYDIVSAMEGAVEFIENSEK